MKKDDINPHYRADKYTTQAEIDRALRDYITLTENNFEVCRALQQLVNKGIKEHLSCGKAWQVKTGRKKLSVNFLACYTLAREEYTNQVIADNIGVTLEAAKGFVKKVKGLSFNEKLVYNIHYKTYQAMLKDNYNILDLLVEAYRG
jgi:hypothetical protein